MKSCWHQLTGWKDKPSCELIDGAEGVYSDDRTTDGERLLLLWLREKYSQL